MARRRRRSGFGGWLLGLIVFLAIAWIGYWYAARYGAGMALERATSAPVAGYDIGCPGEVIGGFPLRIDVACRTVTASARAGVMNAELGGLSATAPLYRPGLVSARLTSPLTVNAPADGLAVTAAWTLGTAEATAGFGGLDGIAGSFLNLEMENAATGGRLPIVALTADAAEGSARPAGGRDYRFAGAARRLHVARATGRELPEADLDLDMTARDFGTTLGKDPRATILAWLRRGGTLSIARAKLRTSGTVIDTDGELTITADGVLSGHLKLRFVNLDALANLIETLRPGSRDKIGPALAALSAMTVPVDTEDGPARETTLVISNGLVAVGIVPVGVLPALRF